MPEKKVAVIDGNSLMHRAFHAVPPTMNAPDGTPTNAVFGFIAMLLKFIDISNPDVIVCAFDAGRPKFRTEALEQYKAQRPPMDPGLKAQFPIIEELLESMSIPVVRVTGWEGDDILGTVAARDEELGYRTLLVSGDKDVYQLCSELTHVVTTRKGITDVAIYGPGEVRERYGVEPSQFPDFLGLKGDSSDNIPGVPGVGDKTAAKLLGAYGSLEGIYEHIDELRGKQKERMEENRDAAFTSRKVATIVRDLDFPLDLEGAAFPAFSAQAVTEAFSKYRFNAHLTRVLKLVGEAPERARSCTAKRPRSLWMQSWNRASRWALPSSIPSRSRCSAAGRSWRCPLRRAAPCSPTTRRSPRLRVWSPAVTSPQSMSRRRCIASIRPTTPCPRWSTMGSSCPCAPSTWGLPGTS